MGKDERILYTVIALAAIGWLVFTIRGNGSASAPDGTNNLQPPGFVTDNLSFFSYNAPTVDGPFGVMALPDLYSGLNGSNTDVANWDGSSVPDCGCGM